MGGGTDAHEKRVRLREGALAWRVVGDEVVALDVERSTYLGVNETGALLWPALSEGTTRGQLVALLVERFGEDPERVARDVDALLADLAARGLLDQVPPS